MSKKFNYILTAFLLLLYIYSIKFTFIPLTGRIYIEVLGIFLFLFTNKNFFPKVFKQFVPIVIIIVEWGFVTMSMNGSSEMLYVHEWLIAPIAAFFGSYFIYKVSRKSITSIVSFLKILCIVVFFESILTVAIKFSPAVSAFVGSIQEFLLTEDDLYKGVNDFYRFAGLGMAVYFGVIPSCAIGVLTSVYLLSKAKTRSEIFLYSTSFLVISIVSFFVAKTSMIVVLLASLFYAYCLFKQRSLKVFSSVIVIAALIAILVNYAASFLPDNVYKWAFDIFIEKDIDTGSSGAVIDTWKDTEFGLTTFWFGDARYAEGTHYYKGVDVGYYREIFYGGIIGLLLVLYFNFKIVKNTMKFAYNKEMRLMLLCLYGSYLIALGKGDLNMSDIFILFFVFYYYLNEEEKKMAVKTISKPQTVAMSLN